MRTFSLLIGFLAASSALAQTDLEGQMRDAPRGPTQYFGMIGQTWDDLEDEFAAPDSTVSIEDGVLRTWYLNEADVEWIQAQTIDGVVVQVVIRAPASLGSEELVTFSMLLREELGRPGPNGFHDATAWQDFREAVGRELPDGAKVQIGVLVPYRSMVIRLTPGSRP